MSRYSQIVWEAKCKWHKVQGGEGWKATSVPDQSQHIAAVKLLTPSPSFGPAAVRDLYLPISCRDVTVAYQDPWSCHPYWCFLTQLSTVSPSCFIFHAVHQTCLSHQPRRKTVISLKTGQLGFRIYSVGLSATLTLTYSRCDSCCQWLEMSSFPN